MTEMLSNELGKPSFAPKAVRFDAEHFWVDIDDGRTIGVPLAWYPRLAEATPDARLEYEVSPRGIHWDGIDEDISLAGLLAGRRDQTVRRHAAA